MKLNKFARAGVKACGAGACGLVSFLSFGISRFEDIFPYGSIFIIIGAGLATSSAILATQSIKDVATTLSKKDEQ